MGTELSVVLNPFPIDLALNLIGGPICVADSLGRMHSSISDVFKEPIRPAVA